jgi:homopolymeric O-antigen transport system ATP-binding protein
MGGRVVEAHDLGKRYRLGTSRHYETIREAIAGSVRRRLWRDENAPVDTREELWALRHVELEVDAGETVGLIGHNGAGKTTLLKILARITDPTEGRARTRGRVGALLEIGTGFHPELTGRENIFLSGAVLGMTGREIRHRFDDIVAFAEVERFLDTPLKRYSAGMYLRLAFSVAAHLEPAIVMVDEVLAVGDVEFRHKCLAKVGELGGEGRTVLFVSHDLGAITRVCPRVVWLDHGTVKADGPATGIVRDYMTRSALRPQALTLSTDPGAAAGPKSVEIVDDRGAAIETPQRGDRLVLRIRLQVRERVPELDLGFELVGPQGSIVIATSMSDELGSLQLEMPGLYEASAAIPPILAAGEYVVRLWLGRPVTTGTTEDLFYRDVLRFSVSPLPDDRRHWAERGHLIQPHLDWRLTSIPSDPDAK